MLKLIEKNNPYNSLAINRTKVNKTFGIASLPSDNMNQVMQQDFNKEFVTSKKQKDQSIADLKTSIKIRMRKVRETNSSRLKSEVQTKNA